MCPSCHAIRCTLPVNPQNAGFCNRWGPLEREGPTTRRSFLGAAACGSIPTRGRAAAGRRVECAKPARRSPGHLREPDDTRGAYGSHSGAPPGGNLPRFKPTGDAPPLDLRQIPMGDTLMVPEHQARQSGGKPAIRVTRPGPARHRADVGNGATRRPVPAYPRSVSPNGAETPP